MKSNGATERVGTNALSDRPLLYGHLVDCTSLRGGHMQELCPLIADTALTYRKTAYSFKFSVEKSRESGLIFADEHHLRIIWRFCPFLVHLRGKGCTLDQMMKIMKQHSSFLAKRACTKSLPERPFYSRRRG